MNDLISIAMDMCVISKANMRNANIVERAEFETFHHFTPYSKSGYRCYYPAVICEYDESTGQVKYHLDHLDQCELDQNYVDVWQLEKYHDWDSSKPFERLSLGYIDTISIQNGKRSLLSMFSLQGMSSETGVYILFRRAYNAKKRVIKTVPVEPKPGIVWKDSNDFYYAIAANIGANTWKVLTDHPTFQNTGIITTIDGYPTERVTEYHWVKV